jgi:hypothetical protein
MLGLSLATHLQHEETIGDAAKRFRWVNNEHFEVITAEGVSLYVHFDVNSKSWWHPVEKAWI